MRMDRREEIYKDGKFSGSSTEWYESGQKHREKTYKDGRFFSGEIWNKDGSVKE